MTDAAGVNVLFTSVGRRVELLRAFRSAYANLGLQGNIVAVDIDPLAPALRVADRPYVVPRLTAPEFIPVLSAICERERVSLAFPLIDPDIPVMAMHRAALEAAGTRLAVVSSDACAITSDKWLTKKWFEKLGLRTPQGWLPGDIDAARAQYPLFIKPRDGSGGIHTFKINSPEELVFFSNYVPNPIIEEYVPGPEITSDVIAWLDGEVLGVVSRQRIEVRWGEVAKGVTVRDPTIMHACRTLARALPACGPMTVQCILRDGVPYFTEINARFGGGVPLGIAAGVASPDWLLTKAAGLTPRMPPIGDYRVGIYLTRYDDSFVLTSDDYSQMESRRL
jgi:carbamoyl-phosphate synthase large subunit